MADCRGWGGMKGIYLLEVIVSRPRVLRIGALGRIRFAPGVYVYVGSAQNGLESRIARHFGERKRTHWHIDYLLSARGVALPRALYMEGPKPQECETARALAAVAEGMPGFGCSDCACPSHLFRMPDGRLTRPPIVGQTWRTLSYEEGPGLALTGGRPQ
jgi:Uri superfamily endonuclease